MQPFPSCSLIVTTYNRPEALELTLKSIFRQSVLPNEIVICDDGSTPDTKDLIEEMKKRSPVPIVHVWQEDEGFRLAKIRNKGLAVVSSDYVIQLDGDVILHKHYVKDHLRFAREGYFISGHRMFLDGEKTRKYLQKKNHKIDFLWEFSVNSWRQIRSPLLQKLMRRFVHSYDPKNKISGCNTSFWLKDVINVNGYNENFEGWGAEDTELGIRLINNGVKFEFVPFVAIQYHLEHSKASKENFSKHNHVWREARKNKTTLCENGIDKYLV